METTGFGSDDTRLRWAHTKTERDGQGRRGAKSARSGPSRCGAGFSGSQTVWSIDNLNLDNEPISGLRGEPNNGGIGEGENEPRSQGFLG